MKSVYLITGFLGSGKTTFLNKQLKDSHKRTGVLMNEFGKVSMDTITVQKDGIDLLELKNGSIFCACLKDQFIDGLIQLAKMDLDEIFIESSGLSDPSDMGKVISIVEKEVGKGIFVFKGTICLVDGVFFFEELKKMVSVERQIAHSHHILINKTDLIDKKKLEEIIDRIKSINPKAGITPIIYGEVDIKSIDLDAFHIDDEESTNKEDNKPKNVVVKFIHEPTKEQLMNFLEDLSESFFRIKGFISIKGIWFKVDLVNSRIDILRYDMEGDMSSKEGFNELVCLTSKGLESISLLAKAAQEHIGGLYSLEI